MSVSILSRPDWPGQTGLDLLPTDDPVALLIHWNIGIRPTLEELADAQSRLHQAIMLSVDQAYYEATENVPSRLARALFRNRGARPSGGMVQVVAAGFTNPLWELVTGVGIVVYGLKHLHLLLEAIRGTWLLPAQIRTETAELQAREATAKRIQAEEVIATLELAGRARQLAAGTASVERVLAEIGGDAEQVLDAVEQANILDLVSNVRSGESPRSAIADQELIDELRAQAEDVAALTSQATAT